LWKNNVVANISNVSNSKKLYVMQLAGQSSNLTIITADLHDAGTYTCTAENKAGKVEASITLAVTRKPPEKVVPGRVIVAGIIVGVLFLLAASLLVFCACNIRKRQINHQCASQSVRRADSYEKIEMNHKVTDNSCNNVKYGNNLHVNQKVETTVRPGKLSSHCLL
jgi:hypothetical protein